MGPRFRVSSERLEKPRIEPTTLGLEGERLNHYVMEASCVYFRVLKTKKCRCGWKPWPIPKGPLQVADSNSDA